MDLVSNGRTKQKKLSDCMSAVVPERQQNVCGSLYLPSTGNVRSRIVTFGKLYQPTLPSKRHKAVGKETGKTNYLERFNCTMRQRIARLVRKTLSFSKKLENPIGAMVVPNM